MSTKQIYLLEMGPTDAAFGGGGYASAMVVRAACETCARSVAAAECGAEGTAVWRDPERSTCKLVKQDGISGVVLRSEG